MNKNLLKTFIKKKIKKSYNFTHQITFNTFFETVLTCFLIFNKKFIFFKNKTTKHQILLKKYKNFIKKKKKNKFFFVFFNKTRLKNKKIFNYIKKYKKFIKLNNNLKQNNSKKKNFKTIKKQANKNFKYSYYFSTIFKKLFKKSVIMINFNYFLKIKIKKFLKLVKKLHFKHKFIKKTIYIYKLLKITLASILFKDSKILTYIIKELFESVHYSKHRMYFTFFKNIIKSFLIKIYKKLNVYGVKLEFHGKLGVGGNSKKRSYYYTVGRCSNSTKFFKVDSTNSFFRTKTGVVGFTYAIYY